MVAITADDIAAWPNNIVVQDWTQCIWDTTNFNLWLHDYNALKTLCMTKLYSSRYKFTTNNRFLWLWKAITEYMIYIIYHLYSVYLILIYKIDIILVQPQKIQGLLLIFLLRSHIWRYLGNYAKLRIKFEPLCPLSYYSVSPTYLVSLRL